VADDDLVDVGLRELLRLDLVLLGRAEEVVEERHVQLQDLDELDDAAVGDVELAVEVEGARIRVRAVLGDLAVVDVAGELGRVLVLLVLGLEGADADPVLLREAEPAHPHVAHHALPVALVLGHELPVDEAAGRAEVPRVRDVVAGLLGELGVDPLAPLLRDQVERLLVHGAGHELAALHAVEVGPLHVPAEGVERPVRRPRVRLQPLLEQPGDGRLRGADRAVQEEDALLRPVSLGRALEDVHELHERDVEAVDGVLAAELGVGEEVVADELLLVVEVLRLPVRQDHVVDALVGRPRDLGVLPHDLEVVLERAFPVLFGVALAVLHLRDAGQPAVVGQLARFAHACSLYSPAKTTIVAGRCACRRARPLTLRG
jgi:hypothetical protein